MTPIGLDRAATVVAGGSVRFAKLLTPDGRVIGRYTANLDRRCYYTDHLGSTRAVVDGSGTVVETRDYYPYGLRMPDRTLEEASSAKEDYTGHERDAETGLHYAGARYYMSARWGGGRASIRWPTRSICCPIRRTTTATITHSATPTRTGRTPSCVG